MKKLFKYILIILIIILSLPLSSPNSAKAEESLHVATYITGIGCPHCSNVALGLLKEMVNDCNDMIIVEYEIYQQPQNSSVIFEFNSNYDSGLGIPLVVFNKESVLVGDKEINNNMEIRCEESYKGTICLPNGECPTWEEFNLNNIPLFPRIWSKDKIAIRIESYEVKEETNDLIKDFLRSDNPLPILESNDLVSSVSPINVEISGGEVEFKNALEIEGWLLQWNGDASDIVSGITSSNHSTTVEISEQKVSLIKTITLALADSVNPCAMAILMMMLIAIVTYNPGDKKAILLSGISFVSAVLVMYLIYGIFIVKFFDLLQNFKSIQSVITPVLSLVMGILALILGVLEVRDFFAYKPGSLGTEMPMNLRPKVQKIISRITSPSGAFTLGMFVTIFLLPCTIGPYFILGGLISTGSTSISSMLPYLFLYNFIFVIPMIIITGIIFFGVKNIDDVKNWKDKNVRTLHLISGILLTGLAIWVLIENMSGILSLFNL